MTDLKDIMRNKLAKHLTEYSARKEEMICELLVRNLSGERLVLIEQQSFAPNRVGFQFHFERGELAQLDYGRIVLQEFCEYFGDPNATAIIDQFIEWKSEQNKHIDEE